MFKLIAKLLCKIFGHKIPDIEWTHDGVCFCERGCGYIES